MMYLYVPPRTPYRWAADSTAFFFRSGARAWVARVRE